MSVDAMNVMLTKNGFAGLSNDGISYGANAYYAFGRALLGADYARASYGEEASSADRTDALRAQQFAFTASFAVVATPHLSIYPTLGVGLGTFDVSVRNRSGGTTASSAQPTFEEVAQSPGTESTLSGSHLLYTLGGGADYLVTRGASDHSGVVFGARAGLAVAPNRTTWSTSGRTVVAGPDASSGGPFLKVFIGFGGH